MNTIQRLILASMSRTRYRSQAEIQQAAERFTGVPVRFYGWNDVMHSLGDRVRWSKSKLAWKRL